MKKTVKILIVLQLLLLVIAIVILLLDEATNVFALLFASPFALASALLLIGSIIHLPGLSGQALDINFSRCSTSCHCLSEW